MKKGSRAEVQGIVAPSVVAGRTATWKAYVTLSKPEITFLVTISAVAGYLIGSPVPIDAPNLLATIIGIALCSASASSLNHAVEWPFDRKMKRTARRPIPAGVLTPRSARIFGWVTGAAGLGLLCPVVNPLTAVLAGLTIILYVYVYTPLKRKTVYNTMVGTIPGALPVLGGYTAAAGFIDLAALPLFGVLLFWQMPHFLSLAWLYRDDYRRGGFQMLPSTPAGEKSAGRQSVAFAILTLAASLSVAAVWNVSAVYLVCAALAGCYFVYASWRFARHPSNITARKLFKASIWYVPFLFVLLAIEYFAN